MLNIEVSHESGHGHDSYLHNVVVEAAIDTDQADQIQMAIEQHDQVTIAFSPIRPGDDIYGYPAEYYQFQFFARCDLTNWLTAVALESGADNG